MNQSSQEHAENTRNIEAALLRALAETGQSRVARTMGLDDATVSKMKGGEIMKMAGFLAALGMKPVKNTELTVERDDFMAMKRFACNWLMADISADEESKRG